MTDTNILIKEIRRCEEIYKHMISLCSSARGHWGWAIVETIYLYPELINYISYDETRRSWADRFQFNYPLINHLMEYGYAPTVVDGIFQDGVDYNSIPEYKGLYFIGESRWNPALHRPEYWVKVGKAVNIKNRLTKNYFCCCGQIWLIDFSREYDKEHDYHKMIERVCLAHNNHNREYFMVDEKTYLEMCAKGFSYFD